MTGHVRTRDLNAVKARERNQKTSQDEASQGAPQPILRRYCPGAVPQVASEDKDTCFRYDTSTQSITKTMVERPMRLFGVETPAPSILST